MEGCYAALYPRGREEDSLYKYIYTYIINKLTIFNFSWMKMVQTYFVLYWFGVNNFTQYSLSGFSPVSVSYNKTLLWYFGKQCFFVITNWKQTQYLKNIE